VAERFNPVAFRDWLRSIYEAGPGLEGAVAITAVVNDVFGKTVQLDQDLSADVFLQRSLQTWRDEVKAMGERLGDYVELLQSGDFEPVAEAILRNNGDGQRVAELSNQILEAVGMDESLGDEPAAKWLREAMSFSLSQLEEAGPGEDPTVRDKMTEALGAGWDNTKRVVLAGAGGAFWQLGASTLVPIGIGVGLAVLGAIWVRKYVV
jgi:hypothetical protein